MGFDLHMVHEPDSLPEGFKPQYDDQPGYLRIRPATMTLLVDIMNMAGILAVVEIDLPDWPPEELEEERANDIADYFDLQEAGEPTDDIVPPTPEETTIWESYRSVLREKLDTPPPKSGVAMANKFLTNDGWLVTPEEAQTIADGIEETVSKGLDWLLEKTPPSDDRDWVASEYRQFKDDVDELLPYWQIYNRLASQHGGYRVC